MAALVRGFRTCSTSPIRRSCTVSVGEPVELKHRALDADTKRIMAAIQRQLPPEAALARKPTEEELRLTYPPGYSGDPDLEVERRPGTD